MTPDAKFLEFTNAQKFGFLDTLAGYDLVSIIQ